MLNLKFALEGLETKPEPITKPTADELIGKVAIVTAKLDEHQIDVLKTSLQCLDIEMTRKNVLVVADQVNSLTSSIKEFGICAPAMKAVDPTENLRNYIQLPAYNELPVAPEKNELCTVALEGLSETSAKLWEKMGETLVNMADNMASWCEDVVEQAGTTTEGLENIKEFYSDEEIIIDGEKFAEIKVSAFKTEDMEAYVREIDKIVNEVTVAVEDIVEKLGGCVKALELDGEVKKAIDDSCRKVIDLCDSVAKYTGIVVDEKMEVFVKDADVAPAELEMKEVCDGEVSKMVSFVLNAIAATEQVSAQGELCGKVIEGLKSIGADIIVAVKENEEADEDKIEKKNSCVEYCSGIAVFAAMILQKLVSDSLVKSRMVLEAAAAGMVAKSEGKVDDDDAGKEDDDDAGKEDDDAGAGKEDDDAGAGKEDDDAGAGKEDE